jgi:hypothetical protein
LPQRQAAGDGVGIGIVLKQDQNRFRRLKSLFHRFEQPHRSRQPDMPAKIRLEEFRHRYEMREGFVFFRKPVTLGRQHKHRNICALLADFVEDFGKALRILGLGEEQVDGICIDLLKRVAVRGCFYER